MKTKFEKSMRIASELLSYCHHNGACEYQLEITEESSMVTHVVKGSPVTISEEQLEHLRNLLGAPRQRDIEQDYWELMGESEDFSELTLIGMLCDEAIVEYEDSTLTITIKRGD